jgi:hypothetical protein
MDIQAEGKQLWSGLCMSSHSMQTPGAIGFLLQPQSYLSVEKFAIHGIESPLHLFYLAEEALLGEGENPADWEFIKSEKFHYGSGYVSRLKNSRVKWNFYGDSATLWSPVGPDYGMARIIIDGKSADRINLFARTHKKSKPVFTCNHLGKGGHAVILEAYDGRIPVDCLEITM